MSKIYDLLLTYQKELKDIQNNHRANELSFRTPLENLLRAFVNIYAEKIFEDSTQNQNIKSSQKSESNLLLQKIKIIHEPKSEENQGSIRPDFKCSKLVVPDDSDSYDHLIGFIECKRLDVELEKYAQSEQIKKYLKITPNIILTNYTEFMLFSFDKVICKAKIFDEALEFVLDDFAGVNSPTYSLLTLLLTFFNDKSTFITTKEELVKVLSSQSFYLSTTLKKAFEILPKDSSFYHYFKSAFNTFNSIEGIDSDEIEFCDILAQSVIYSIFVSFIENENLVIKNKRADEFMKLLPSQFVVLTEFIYLSIPSFAISQNIKNVLENVIKALALINKHEIAKSINQDIESISIYLYEDFLKEYDKLCKTDNRMQGGVFYTPKEVVNAITSSLEWILKNRFNYKNGFADPKVKVLDFATGTGSFLHSVYEKILSQEKLEPFRHEAIKNKLLKDIYGFEISFVPYIVARLKLGSMLKKHNFDVNNTDFKIYLNNTLDLDFSRDIKYEVPLWHLSREHSNAKTLKKSHQLLVILGNPPYNGKSKNNGDKILNLLEDYKKGLDKTEYLKPLHNDYIKFIRFAQWNLLENHRFSQNTNPELVGQRGVGLEKKGVKETFDKNLKDERFIESKSEKSANFKNLDSMRSKPRTLPDFKESQESALTTDLKNEPHRSGLLGLISANSFLYGKTHRRMRESLAQGFDEIYIINLHGDNGRDKKEDKNVFDIKVGVCISLFVKYPHNLKRMDAGFRVHKNNENIESNSEKNAKVFYYSTQDNEIFRRQDKFAFLNEFAKKGLESIKWQEIKLDATFYWFTPIDLKHKEKYDGFWAVAGDKAGDTRSIFNICGSGSHAQRDKICIQRNRKELDSVLYDFLNLDSEIIKNTYRIKDSRDWSVAKAKQDVINHKDSLESKIYNLTYRPFDTRITFFTRKSKGFWGVPSINAKYFLNQQNLGLCLEKGVDSTNTTFVVDKIIEGHCIGSGTYIAPLYTFVESGLTLLDNNGNDGVKKRANFSEAFLAYKNAHKILKTKSPEQILFFIYATLFSPSFTSKYREYLKIGFPRVDFEVGLAEFDRLENLGQRLIDLHLMKDEIEDSEIDFSEDRNAENSLKIDAMRDVQRFKDGCLLINKRLKITGITQEIRDFKIGKVQVLSSYFKYRKEYICSVDELKYILQICRIIKASVGVIKEIG